jgi:hypothetical protein
VARRQPKEQLDGRILMSTTTRTPGALTAAFQEITACVNQEWARQLQRAELDIGPLGARYPILRFKPCDAAAVAYCKEPGRLRMLESLFRQATGFRRVVCIRWTLPEYRRPFKQRDFLGYFRWTDLLSERLGGSLCHACHAEELGDALAEGELPLHSRWNIRLPEHGVCKGRGVWCGLNSFSNGNYFGPCLMKFPISVLRGRTFMVFHRRDDRDRYSFVQHESPLPAYTPWRRVTPQSFFQSSNRGFCRKDRAIYELVLTAPLSLQECTISPVNHPHCISRRCSGANDREAHEIIRGIAREHLRWVLAHCEEIQALLKQFPCLKGQKVSLESADDDE